MKAKAMIMSVIMVAVSLWFGFNAIGGEVNDTEMTKVYAHLVDRHIAKCDAKMEMKTSGLKNIRRAAAIATLKGTFTKNYREELIASMIEEGIEPKGYKVELYLNERFYSLVR
jgi:hypothetical protein